jgi:hypothetical protein
MLLPTKCRERPRQLAAAGGGRSEDAGDRLRPQPDWSSFHCAAAMSIATVGDSGKRLG